MNRQKLNDFSRAFINLLGLFLIGIIALISFSKGNVLKENPPLFSWPNDMSLNVQLEGSILLDELTPFSSKQEQYPFYIELVANPLNSIKHSFYQIRLKRFVLHDKKNILLMDFDRASSTEIHYRIDSRLPSKKQEQILDLLNIGTSNQNISDDHSLLRLPLKVGLTNEGAILELSIASQVQKMLTENLNAHPLFRLIESLINTPDQIPSLGPKGNNVSWGTEGYYVTPLKFTHKKLHDGDYQSKGYGTKSLANILTTQNWDFKWKIRKENFIPNDIDFHFNLQQVEKHFSTNSTWNIDLNCKIEVEEVRTTPIIDVVSIEDEIRSGV